MNTWETSKQLKENSTPSPISLLHSRGNRYLGFYLLCIPVLFLVAQPVISSLASGYFSCLHVFVVIRHIASTNFLVLTIHMQDFLQGV